MPQADRLTSLSLFPFLWEGFPTPYTQECCETLKQRVCHTMSVEEMHLNSHLPFCQQLPLVFFEGLTHSRP